RPRLAPCHASRQSPCPPLCLRFTCSRTTGGVLHPPSPPPPGEWEMDRPFTPYELDLAIRDSSHGAASGLDAILNEFLQCLGPVARGRSGTMINICLSDGCVPMSRKKGDTIPVPKFGKDPLPHRELQTDYVALCLA
ncbi:uncharacterized protein Tco025E_09900, partial [Trypanosoma conorhini]